MSQPTCTWLPATRRGRRALSRQGDRRAAAAVEFAMVAPIAFAFFFAAIDFGRMNMVRHTMNNAVYEAARTGLVANSTTSDMTQTANTVLGTVGARNAVVDAQIIGNAVTVTISLPCKDQGWVGSSFFGNRTMSTSLTLYR